MRQYIIVSILLFTLSGCYTLNQEKLETYVADNFSVGMSLSNASTYFENDGFTCDSKNFKPLISCVRSFNNLPTLQNCQERIYLYPNQSHTEVEKIETMQIMCIGF